MTSLTVFLTILILFLVGGEVTKGFAFAMLIVAVISPLLSSIADYKGNKKSFLNFFLCMGSISCAALFFFKDTSTLYVGITFMILACIGFWASLVYYNSYLPEIATLDMQDKVSAKGFGMGYFGSSLLLIINLIIVMKYDMFGFANKGSASRFSFLTVGIWWVGFAQITFAKLPNGKKSIIKGEGNIIFKGFNGTDDLH